MLRTMIAVCAVAMALAAPLAAQQDGREQVYIQIQARATLAAAQDSARDLSGRLADINGFALGGGWYGIAMGPYDRATAETILRRLRARGDIPRDSYLEGPERYGARFWPMGAADMDAARTAETERATQAAPDPAERPETLAEARASEAQLDRAAREELQIALQWAGYYRAAIDGAFGRGTRGAMAAWQAENGFDATGVLTTRQRADLLARYNAVFDGLGFARYSDPRAGIAMELPLDVVAFDRHEAPFAVFAPTGELPARVLLISQPGDRQTMNGLYEIMQTLRIVPPEGPRQRDASGFTLTGTDDDIVSHTEVRLSDGAIKGFTLVWPAGDEGRRTRVLDRIRDSVAFLPGTLDPAAVGDDAQRVDLVAGLAVRQPIATASGFFVDRAGRVLTSTAAIGACSRITLDDAHDARVVARDDTLGLAVLRPDTPLSPRRVAQFRADTPRLQSEIAVAGYSFGGVLGAPSLTFGTLEDLRGLGGEAGLKRLALAPEPGDAGGPVLDDAGAVLGMLLPRDRDGARLLPEGVSFAATTGEILDFLDEAGIDAVAREGSAPLHPEDLTRLAAEMTVLVSCWD